METDLATPADPAAIGAFRQAQAAARAAALAGLFLAGLALWWIWYAARTGSREAAEVAGDSTATAHYVAELHLLVVSRSPMVELPVPLAWALVLLGPFLAGLASVAAWRWARRDPPRCPRALALLAAGCILAILPGLMIHLQFLTKTESSSGSNGLGPAPMCGGLALFIAGYAGWVLLHHGPVLRAGAPPGAEPD